MAGTKTQSSFNDHNDREIYSVSRLVHESKAVLESRFPLIWIEGEISNLSRPSSGHLYFSLKDEHTQVRCALFRGSRRALSAEPLDGMLVLVRARVSLYEARGDFQLIVETLEPAGEGALRRAYEMLKQSLEKEGLFATTHKKPLPRLPRRIGVITSPSGAVFHDIRNTLARRFPAIQLLLYPVPVQGEGAADQIAQMIGLAGSRRDCDALIVARGGGSLEDLWAFNQEIVARALYQCPLPVVSAIGHETDFTIADFVADVRAPTPTAAAEMLSPDQYDWLAQLDRNDRRLRQMMRDRLRADHQTLDFLAARIIRPDQVLAAIGQRLTSLYRHLGHVMSRTIDEIRSRVNLDQTKLIASAPSAQLREQGMRVEHQRVRLLRQLHHNLERIVERVARSTGLLDALSPLSTLSRGYAIATTEKGTIIRSSDKVRAGDGVNVRLAQGLLNCRVESKIDED